jgi:hypothetical protein
MHRSLTSAILILTAVGVLAGCAKSSQSTAPASPEAAATASGSATQAATTGATAAATAGTSESPTAAAATGSAQASSSTAIVVVSFTDVAGTFAEQNINDEARLGVFDATSGTFEPETPIKRGEFVRWMVKANNAYYHDNPSRQIRPAEGTEQTFVDVPASNPDYRYIQALANAGLVVGVDATHFAPDDDLTREQMIAIKAGLDLGGDPHKNTNLSDVKTAYPFTDDDQISKRYYDAIYGDYFDGSKNIPRVFGAIKTFHPQKPVTRAEAAVALDKIGNYSPMTAEQALPQPTPSGQ